MIAAIVRRFLWRLVIAGTGGLRVDGHLPGRPCVLVANHASHADTAALIAALPARRRPVIAAAADYWFGGPVRTAVCRALAAAFPVRRDGGGSGDLASAAAMLAAGRDVIVFPEGTRTRDGSIGVFRSGAERLARQAGAPLVPVGIAGTHDLLPVHGRLGRGRITVRVGDPVPGIAAARTAVAELAAAPAGRRVGRAVGRWLPWLWWRLAFQVSGGLTRVGTLPPGGCVVVANAGSPADVPAPVPVADSRIRLRLAALAGSGAGLLLMAAWAFGEALILPLLPEFALAILAVAAPRRAVRLAVAAIAGSLAGGALMYALAAHGVNPPAPLTTPRMHAVAAHQVAGEGAAAMRRQPMSGVPYKVYGQAAGHARVGLGPFVLASVPARAVRILAVSASAGVLGAALRRWRRWYPLYLVLFVTVFAAGLSAVVRSWS